MSLPRRAIRPTRGFATAARSGDRISTGDARRYSKKANKRCSWVEKKPEKRCKAKTKNDDGVDAFAGCPEACGVCELECGEDSDVWYLSLIHI